MSCKGSSSPPPPSRFVVHPSFPFRRFRALRHTSAQPRGLSPGLCRRVWSILSSRVVCVDGGHSNLGVCFVSGGGPVAICNCRFSVRLFPTVRVSVCVSSWAELCPCLLGCLAWHHQPFVIQQAKKHISTLCKCTASLPAVQRNSFELV